MICPACRKAGKVLQEDADYARHYHQLCRQNRTDGRGAITHVEPTQCDCQHSVQSVLASPSDGR